MGKKTILLWHWSSALLLASLLSTPLAADNNTTSGSGYSTWNKPDTDSRKFVKELRQLVDKADDANAADPKFLRDLRKLASRYDSPLLKTLFTDNFRDGDFKRNPAWHVVSGEFWIDPNVGLRSKVDQYQTNKNEQQPTDIGQALMGALIKELGKDKKKNKNHEQSRSQPAIIRLDHRISNAFVMSAELVSVKSQGRVDFALYQDSRKLSGYRLSYIPGSNQPFQFLRVSEHGETVIDAYRSPLNLGNNQIHALEWRRDQAGEMSLKLNGKLLFSRKDSWLRKDFSGFALINNGGDYGLRSITLSEIY